MLKFHFGELSCITESYGKESLALLASNMHFFSNELVSIPGVMLL
jgi:hypothetical protein